MSEVNIPRSVRVAASKFNKQRAEYYGFLASMLSSSKGRTKLSEIFERDAQRYWNRPRGVLAAHWMSVYMSNGGLLSEAWQGTLPDDEVSIIRVAQDAGPGALEAALADVARIANLSDRVKSEVTMTLSAGIAGIAIALLMTTVFVVFFSAKLQEIYSFIPLSEWGPTGRAFNAHAERVKNYGVYGVILVVGLIWFFNWSINNLTGPIRDWLDSRSAVYRVIRDIKGALFLSTMSTLTRKRGNVMFTLGDSLSSLAQSAKSPWLKWRIEEIVGGINANGATGSEAFNTNLISEEMYFFLRDSQESTNFAEGFAETGKYVESKILNQIIKRMTIYRWVLLLSGVACVVGVVMWQTGVIYEMKGVVANYYSSR